MPYPYGTQGAPAVGNGLGGLPRRAATTAVASTRRTGPIKLQTVGSAISKNLGAMAVYVYNVCKLSNGKGIATHPNYGASGFTYNKDGMIGWATEVAAASTAVQGTWPFAGGMIAWESTSNLSLYVTNGTTTSKSTLVSIPASGTLDNAATYSNLSNVYGMTHSSIQPGCFDADGNFVAIKIGQVNGGSWWALAFIISPAGSIIGKKNLFILDGTGARNTNGYFTIRKSGSGFIVAACYASAPSYFGVWNVASDYTVTTITYTISMTMYGGSQPQYFGFFLDSSAFLFIAENGDGYTSGYSAKLNSNGAVISNSSSALNNYPYGSDHVYGGYQNYDNANNLYIKGYGPKFRNGNNDAAYFDKVRVISGSSLLSSDDITVYAENVVTAGFPPIEMTGTSGSSMYYLNDGYWALCWGNNNGDLKAQLLKEV